MPFKSYREESRENYGQKLESEKDAMCNDQIKLGCLLRIADATELIAKNHQKLIDERDMYKRWYEEACQRNLTYLHRIAGLRGYIKRLQRGKK